MIEIEQRLLDTKIIAIIRGDYRETAIPLVQALYDGGIRAVEITMNSPDAIQIIARLVEHFGDKLLIGGGTVLEENQVRSITEVGGQFIVSPDTYPPVISLAIQAGLVPLPGALSPTEIMTAKRAGAKLIKLFPATQVQPNYIKQVLAPLNDLKLFPTGGINSDNAKNFLTAGASGFGVGNTLIPNDITNHPDFFESITQRAHNFIQSIK